MHRDPLVHAFQPLEPDADCPPDDLTALTRRPRASRTDAMSALPPGMVEVVTLHGFDLDDRALVRGVAALPGELVVARSTIALHPESIGALVVVVLEQGDPRRPIVLGVLVPECGGAPGAATHSTRVEPGASVPLAAASAERLVFRAQREIVLECGDASITLTRAGKVLIRGNHIVSRASGYNRIKGAAIDIN